MFKLSLIAAIFLATFSVIAQTSPHGKSLNIKCEVCHTPNGWRYRASTFDHSQTGFALDGQHKTVDCRKCHVDLVFKNAKTDCNACHKDVHQQTVGQDCRRCHTTQTWVVNNIKEIHRQTRFPLNGGHATADCYSCHKSASRLRFEPMNTECVSCHQKDYNATTNPSHRASKFPTNCTLCHTEKSWQKATFNHNTNTNFPLKNAHLGLECSRCHTAGYRQISTACVSCHQKDYNATVSPAHAPAKFSTECLSCHNDISWKPSTFKHDVNTSFKLNGSHKGVDCISCHKNGQFAGTASTCVSCHKSNFDATTNPNHSLGKFSTECQSCHNENVWKPSSFNHNTATSFPLKSSHIGVDCASCHKTTFAGTGSNCVDCHLANYNGTTNPNHVTSKFPKDCQLCHTETTWQSATFDHNTTNFPLKGSHSGLDCAKCHANGYTGTPTTCVSCHQANYNATVSPSHTAAKFSTDCQTCHNETAWKPSTFNHNTATSFPLKGSHTTVDCIGCHSGGFAGTSKNCVDCHLANYNSTTNPNHVTAKFAKECQTCHNETAWKPSTFNHSTATSFPLKGKHVGVDCISCHKNGYAGISTACSSCHMTDFNSTTNPNHVTSKFATTCETCHTVNGWTPSTFNHANYFPITSGRHNVACTICHTNSANYAQFTCLTASCHPKSSTDSDHRGESGYVYNSANCYSCHPKGKS